MRTDDELKSFLVNKNYKTHYNSLFNKLSIEEQEYIISKYPDSININEVIYRFLNNIDIRPVCKNCGGFIKSFRADRGFGNFCSKSCATEYNNKMRNSIKYLHDGMYNKYGVDNPLKIQEIKDKIKTINIKKYGVECTLQNKEVRNKIKQTLKEKYGVEYSPLAIKGMEDGSFKKYGTKYPAQSNLYWENYNFEKAKIKEYETKRKNNSFNKSKPEDICYNLLKEKYSNIIRQYSSKEYPFNCDFFIP